MKNETIYKVDTRLGHIPDTHKQILTLIDEIKAACKKVISTSLIKAVKDRVIQNVGHSVTTQMNVISELAVTALLTVMDELKQAGAETTEEKVINTLFESIKDNLEIRKDEARTEH